MLKYKIKAKELTESCVSWIKDWFDENGPGCKAIIGMSGGKDSTIAAALCVKALGKDRVIGVAMPDGVLNLNEADLICNELGIKLTIVNISDIVDAIHTSISGALSEQAIQNIPPRVRTAVLMAYAQSNNGRVINTCNLSEKVLGYMTLFGDDLGSCAPIANLTVTEVKAIGHYLGITSEYVEKIPDDGLEHSMPDEEKFGFTYAELDAYIREGTVTKELQEKIDGMILGSRFKRQIVKVPAFFPSVSDMYENEIL